MNQLTCRQAVDFLADYLGDELPRAEREVFEAHLLVCDACVLYLRRYQETIRLERDAFDCDEAEIPPTLVDAILAARRR